MVLEPGELSGSGGTEVNGLKRSKFDQKTARTDGRNLEVHGFISGDPKQSASSS